MRKSLITYLIYGGSLLALYGAGGFSGWWKGIRLLPRAGVGATSGGSGHGGYGGGFGGGSGGGGFRGGK